MRGRVVDDVHLSDIRVRRPEHAAATQVTLAMAVIVARTQRGRGRRIRSGTVRNVRHSRLRVTCHSSRHSVWYRNRPSRRLQAIYLLGHYRHFTVPGVS